ncbi:50S ribosomal protein L30e [Candidatus Bathyarchaeota archaeon]|nr:50S ribosomal protein L30e [Candidatus Bathyarchaeota archaeon]
MIDLDRVIRLAIKSKKIHFGSKITLSMARSGRATAIIIASNSPNSFRSDIEYYSKLSGIPLYTYNGTNLDLSLTCDKKFSISALAIRETVDSRLLRMLTIQTPETE